MKEKLVMLVATLVVADLETLAILVRDALVAANVDVATLLGFTPETISADSLLDDLIDPTGCEGCTGPVGDPPSDVAAIAKEATNPSAFDKAKALALDIMSGGKEPGKIYAQREQHVPVFNAWTGTVVTSGGHEYLVMGEIKGRGGFLLCKKLDAMGQAINGTVIREAGKVKVIGDASEKTVGVPAAKDAPVINVDAKGDVAVTANMSYPLTIPDGTTHVVFVQKDGDLATWESGDPAKILTRGKKGRMVVEGRHPRWSKEIASGAVAPKFV